MLRLDRLNGIGAGPAESIQPAVIAGKFHLFLVKFDEADNL